MTIEKSILINTSPEKIWKVFTDPKVTRQMGGEYTSEWKDNSFFGWKNLNGQQITFGQIIHYNPGSMLEHRLFTGEDQTEISSVITYRTEETNGKTTLYAQEKLMYDVSDAEQPDLEAGWDAALKAVKELAEKL
jgi:uncharacterized protein YndB with AHSA1/START domain